MDVFGEALSDYFNNNASDILWLHNSYGDTEEMPVDEFFRTEAEMPELELLALTYCKDKTLDVGAGVGSHSLILQSRGFDISALEISESACSIMKQRGLKKILNADFFAYNDEKFDTLLLLMNGIGLTEYLQNLDNFLDKCAELLKPNGQVIFDSSDIAYLFEEEPFPAENYYGEISFCYEYKNTMGKWFNWLYVDKENLTAIANKKGWNFEVLFEDDHYQYLGKLTLK